MWYKKHHTLLHSQANPNPKPDLTAKTSTADTTEAATKPNCILFHGCVREVYPAANSCCKLPVWKILRSSLCSVRLSISNHWNLVMGISAIHIDIFEYKYVGNSQKNCIFQ